MYRLAQRHNQDWGIPEYQVQSKHLDHQTLAFEKLHFKYATNEVKKPKPASVNSTAKRPNFLDDLEKREKGLPEPWKYNTNPKWLLGFNAPHISENVGKKQQELKFKWLNVPSEKQEIIPLERAKSSKIDMKVSKVSFIDQIIRDNSKAEYPKPGPGQYFLDGQVAKKLYPEKTDLVALPSTERQEVSTKDKMPLTQKERKAKFGVFLFRKKRAIYSSAGTLSKRR